MRTLPAAKTFALIPPSDCTLIVAHPNTTIFVSDCKIFAGATAPIDWALGNSNKDKGLGVRTAPRVESGTNRTASAFRTGHASC
jgi:hypothetical protein